MATPNPDSRSTSTATQQVTIAVFSKYIKTMEEKSPMAAPTSPVAENSIQDTTDENLLSPSAITPTHEPGDLWSEPALSTNQTQVRIDVNTLVRDMGHTVEQPTATNEQTDIIVGRLRIIGDEFDRDLAQHGIWTIIATHVLSPNSLILHEFSKTIRNLKKELSFRMIVKIFSFGYRLLTTLRPTDYYSEEQWKILSVFVNFLLNELSDWIDQQGGWENILRDNGTTRMHSYSTSDLPDHEIPNPLEEDRTPDEITPEFELGCETPPSTRSNSFPAIKKPESLSLSIPESRSRPRTLRLDMPHSFPRQSSRDSTGSPSTTPTRSRGSLRDVVAFGIGMSFGFALFSYFNSK